MANSKTVIIIGCRGALGAAISRRFTNAQWRRVLVGVSPTNDKDEPDSVYINLAEVSSPKTQYDLITSSLYKISSSQECAVDAVVNVSGGFCMDSANVRFTSNLRIYSLVG